MVEEDRFRRLRARLRLEVGIAAGAYGRRLSSSMISYWTGDRCCLLGAVDRGTGPMGGRAYSRDLPARLGLSLREASVLEAGFMGWTRFRPDCPELFDLGAEFRRP